MILAGCPPCPQAISMSPRITIGYAGAQFHKRSLYILVRGPRPLLVVPPAALVRAVPRTPPPVPARPRQEHAPAIRRRAVPLVQPRRLARGPAAAGVLPHPARPRAEPARRAGSRPGAVELGPQL